MCVCVMEKEGGRENLLAAARVLSSMASVSVFQPTQTANKSN